MPQTATSCGGTRSRSVSTSPLNPRTAAATPLATAGPAPTPPAAQAVVHARVPAAAARTMARGRAWQARAQPPAIPADAASPTAKGTVEDEVVTTVSGIPAR